MTLGDLIETLEAADPEHWVKHGFGEPHSYRGDYSEVAFTPVDDVTVGSMLAHARAALGQTFIGYKGGEYTMHEFTPTWIAEYGRSNATGIGPTLLKYWLEDR